MAVSRRLRFEILRRDNHQCRYCGAAAPDVKLTVDHVVPVALGGNDEPTNLVTACQPCNAGKAASSPDDKIVADVAEDAIRWARAVHAAAGLIRSDHQAVDAQIDALATHWDDRWNAEGQAKWGWPECERGAFRMWIDRGLTADDMGPLMDMVIDKWSSKRLDKWDSWRYFAGCCWRRLTDIETKAREIVEQES